uniref:Uncharacterized protein LOC104221668 n=1 Tax=Nicotiana sylvestris TaxID=4096 RepID=A0A1U7W1J9_NICSY|nr:PREDICTED: uncharacterized protein LOC104221668 [Nicotiana sylvestris]
MGWDGGARLWWRLLPAANLLPPFPSLYGVNLQFNRLNYLYVAWILFKKCYRSYLFSVIYQAAATAAALAKKYGADITVVVIDEKEKEAVPEHETQLASIRWHLSEGGYQEFKLLERLGEGSKPTAIIGEIADEMNLDVVIMSMEAIHSKHVDANLLAEFIPCPVLLLPL